MAVMRRKFCKLPCGADDSLYASLLILIGLIEVRG